MKFHKVSDKIFTVSDFLSAEECDQYIALSEKINYELAKVDADKGQRVVAEVRNNSRAFYDNTELADLLWQKVQPSTLR